MKMMRTATAVAALHLLALPLHAQQITLLQTSDLHGYIYPFDYFRNRDADIGVARVATMVESVRSEGRPVLLLDAGDTIQGSALAYVHQRKHPGPHEPTMLAMNRVGFDAMAVGNHEFNFGLEVLQRARNDASFPWLSANVVTEEGGTLFEPYLVKELNGVKVGDPGPHNARRPDVGDARELCRPRVRGHGGGCEAIRTDTPREGRGRYCRGRDPSSARARPREW